MTKTTGFLVNQLFAFARNIEIEQKALLEAASLPSNTRVSDAGGIPTESFHSMLTALAHKTGDQNIGLRFGQTIELDSHESFNEVFNKETLILGRLNKLTSLRERFRHLLIDAGPAYWEIENNSYKSTWRMSQPSFSTDRYLVDAMISMRLKSLKKYQRLGVTVKRIRLHYSKPSNACYLADLASCRVDYDQSFPGLTVVVPALSLAEDEIVEGKENGIQRGRLESVMARQLPAGNISIGSVAKEFGVSQRTLQRKLASENSTFTIRLTEVKKELANRYLVDQGYSLEDTAFLLGFSTHSNFSKAFKHWYGQSPSDYVQNRSDTR